MFGREGSVRFRRRTALITKLEIKTNDKDLKVLARKGYYAMPDEKQ